MDVRMQAGKPKIPEAALRTASPAAAECVDAASARILEDAAPRDCHDQPGSPILWLSDGPSASRVARCSSRGPHRARLRIPVTGLGAGYGTTVKDMAKR